MSIFETLKKLQNEQSKKIEPSYIYLEDNQIKEKKISDLLDSAGSALINRTMKGLSSAQEIHKVLFGAS